MNMEKMYVSQYEERIRVKNQHDRMKEKNQYSCYDMKQIFLQVLIFNGFIFFFFFLNN